MGDSNKAGITGVQTVGIPVTDQDKALEFYVGTLGLETLRDVPMGEGRRWIEVAPPGAATSVALVVASAEAPSGFETGIHFTTVDADGAHAHLVDAGVDVEEVLRWPGVPAMFAFRDPDGNRLELVEDAGR